MYMQVTTIFLLLSAQNSQTNIPAVVTQNVYIHPASAATASKQISPLVKKYFPAKLKGALKNVLSSSWPRVKLQKIPLISC